MSPYLFPVFATTYLLCYHSIKITGSVSPDTRVLVCAPHSSFLDVLLVTLKCRITAPTRAENLQHGFFGKILRLLQLIPVSRVRSYYFERKIIPVSSFEWPYTILDFSSIYFRRTRIRVSRR